MVEPLADVETAFRDEARRALATVARLVGDLDVAEDAVQEAYAIAVERWSVAGVPDRPGAWITSVARNRALDTLRREARRGDREREAMIRVLEATPPVVHPVEDDRLQLLFVCCHPAFAPEVRAALALRFVCGLRVPEIARVLLESEEAVAKRLQRAKHKIRTATIPLRMPPAALLTERFGSVLECVYLLFTEGYAATSGPSLIREDLCEEALRLARLLTRLLPDEPGGDSLLALLLLQDSRRAARIDAQGLPVLLADQDRSRWNRAAIDEGLSWLARAGARREMTTAAAAYLLQAAIAGEHARAASWAATDWPAIVHHYSQLALVNPSPVVLANRAIAVSFADGPHAAIPELEALLDEPRLARSTLVPAALAELHHRIGNDEIAAAHCRTALHRAATEPERDHLRRRLGKLEAACAAAAQSGAGS